MLLINRIGHTHRKNIGRFEVKFAVILHDLALPVVESSMIKFILRIRMLLVPCNEELFDRREGLPKSRFRIMGEVMENELRVLLLM